MDKGKRRTFLTARWTDLVFLSWKANEVALRPYIPPGLDLDCFDGTPILSLVAFRFLDAHLFGIRAPLFHSFAELNLRFYVREPESGRIGVVFIREICPYHLVAWTARLFFNERFLVAPSMFARDAKEYCYSFATNAAPHRARKDVGTILVQSQSQPYFPEQGSFSHFVIERYHGFSSWYRGKTLHYDVAHAPWNVEDAAVLNFQIDAAYLYGKDLAEILSHPPTSMFISSGSMVDLSVGTQLVPRTNNTTVEVWNTHVQES